MARILIAGCGYVGEATADLFHERGWAVEGWTASAESAGQLTQKPYAVRARDIADAAAVLEISGQFDVVVQCVSSSGGEAEQYRRLYLEGARNLIRSFPEARLLFTSSTSVYGQKDGEIVDEDSPAEPGHEKGKILRETEELVLAHGGIVLRLGAIQGPGRSFFLSRFLEGTVVIDLNERRFINQTHRDDIASALLLLAERGERGIFNVVGDEPITASEAYDWLSFHLKKPLPPAAKRHVKPRKRGESNKHVSNKKLRMLGWEPQYPTFRAAMTKSILPSFGF
jgi:nucleoside-diphosphate-sugar epimerase